MHGDKERERGRMREEGGRKRRRRRRRRTELPMVGRELRVPERVTLESAPPLPPPVERRTQQMGLWRC